LDKEREISEKGNKFFENIEASLASKYPRKKIPEDSKF